MATLTAADMLRACACNDDLAAFRELYGEAGNEVTMERCMAGALRFDWVRGAKILLNEKQQQYFRVLMLNAFRGLNRSPDPDMRKRRTAMAAAFCTAYNSPKE